MRSTLMVWLGFKGRTGTVHACRQVIAPRKGGGASRSRLHHVCRGSRGMQGGGCNRRWCRCHYIRFAGRLYMGASRALATHLGPETSCTLLLYADRSTRGGRSTVHRETLHGGVVVLFYADVRSILMVSIGIQRPCIHVVQFWLLAQSVQRHVLWTTRLFRTRD